MSDQNTKPMSQDDAYERGRLNGVVKTLRICLAGETTEKEFALGAIDLAVQLVTALSERCDAGGNKEEASSTSEDRPAEPTKPVPGQALPTPDQIGTVIGVSELRCPACREWVRWPRKDGLPLCPNCGGKIGDW